MKLFLGFLLLLLPALALPALTFAAPELTAHYYVPPEQFNASVQVMKTGASNITGLFSNATGGFSYDDGSKTLSSLKLAIDATSIVASNSENKNAINNLLSVGQFPEIRFTSLEPTVFTDGKGSIKGTLTVHGTSKPVTFDALITGLTKTPHSTNAFAGESSTVAVSVHGSFKRADFGMGDAADATAVFGDTINLQLEMQALKQ